MTSILKISSLVLIAWCGVFGAVYAQESVTLSVSPTLIDISAEPGQAWQSKLRVVNVNNFDLTVYVEVVNFAPKGEGGDGTFLPLDSSTQDGSSLAEWISINREPIVIPREQTGEIPFTVMVPKDASPGGHFAAVLVGTKPPVADSGQARLQTAQMVTSLFFARVAGDVVESGAIREFTTDNTVMNNPEVGFTLRFENKGNVHLRPQGEIKIYNMWGEERGIVPINQYSSFGNVLPESIRKYDFTWKGEWSLSEMGRYSAVATLGFGADEKQFASSKVYFWVIPFKLVFGILLGLVIFIVIITWLVRLYVRHMLSMAGIRLEDYKKSTPYSSFPIKPRITAPVEAGILDLTRRLRTTVSLRDRIQTLLKFIVQYRLFFIGASLIIIFITLIVSYLFDANTKYRSYEVVYENSGSETSITSEEILYDRLVAENGAVSEQRKINEALPKLRLVNRSGIPGVAAETQRKLEALGYDVQKIEADFTTIQSKNVIAYPESRVDAALRLSAELGRALVTVQDGGDTQFVVYLGTDALPE